jgi:hypothetical protein
MLLKYGIMLVVLNIAEIEADGFLLTVFRYMIIPMKGIKRKWDYLCL